MSVFDRLAIGTANWNQVYAGRKARDTDVILDYCICHGIDMLDVAQAYGPVECSSYFNLNGKGAEINQTLEMFGPLYSYMAHDPATLIGQWPQMHKAKYDYKVCKIGASFYYPQELEAAMQKFRLDIIQVPYSIYDRRFEYLFPILAANGVEIHVRSVFLRGKAIKPIAGALPAEHYCLVFPLLNKYVDRVVFGVDSPEQLLHNLSFFDSFEKFQTNDEKVLIPMNWDREDSNVREDAISDTVGNTDLQ